MATTRVSDWSGVTGIPGNLTRKYTKVYLFILGYIMVPIILAIPCNLAGWQEMVWMILFFSTVVDLWVIFHPWFPGFVSAAGFLRGQPGGEEGLSAEDGAVKAWDWLKKAYSMAIVTILGKQVALVALVFLPVSGFGGVALAILAIVLLVILGTVQYSKKAIVVNWFWYFYIAILVALMGYWILAGVFFPDLRQSPAHAEVSSVQQAIRDQNDAYLKGEAKKIGEKLAAMPGHLTEAERIAKLSKEEQVIWKWANNSSFGRKSTDVAKDVGNKAVTAVSGFLFWRTQEKSLTLSGDLNQIWKVCGLEPGKWRYDLVGNPTILADTGGYDIKLRGVPQTSDPVNYPRYRGVKEGPRYDWALLADGVAPGENLLIGKSGCVEMTINLFADVLIKTKAQRTKIIDPKEVEIVFEKAWW